jgi:hypothetical protein
MRRAVSTHAHAAVTIGRRVSSPGDLGDPEDPGNVGVQAGGLPAPGPGRPARRPGKRPPGSPGRSGSPRCWTPGIEGRRRQAATEYTEAYRVRHLEAQHAAETASSRVTAPMSGVLAVAI